MQKENSRTNWRGLEATEKAGCTTGSGLQRQNRNGNHSQNPAKLVPDTFIYLFILNVTARTWGHVTFVDTPFRAYQCILKMFPGHPRPSHFPERHFSQLDLQRTQGTGSSNRSLGMPQMPTPRGWHLGHSQGIPIFSGNLCIAMKKIKARLARGGPPGFPAASEAEAERS